MGDKLKMGEKESNKISHIYAIHICSVGTDTGKIHFTDCTIEDYETGKFNSFDENKFKDEDIESIFLKEFDKIDWEYVDTRIIPITETLPDSSKEYYMIFKNDLGIDSPPPELLYKLLKISEDIDACFILYDFSLNYYQNFIDGEYDSGYMEGNEFPEDINKKLKKSLGL